MNRPKKTIYIFRKREWNEEYLKAFRSLDEAKAEMKRSIRSWGADKSGTELKRLSETFVVGLWRAYEVDWEILPLPIEDD